MARPELAEILAEGQRGYGAYFSPGSARTATGLSPTEEDLLLPYILNIPKDDKDFRKAVNVHYEGISIKVPGKEGLKLEIGLEGSNSEPVSKDNLPINVDNYLKYRHALGHPWIAPSETEGKGNQLKQYYIFNPSEVSKVNINVNEQRDKALGLYLSIKDNSRTVRMYLTLLGVRTDQLRTGEEVLRLRELVDKKPEDFIKLYNDRDKEIKYIIEDMINNNILERVNGNILVKDDGTKLGQDMKTAILFLTDTRNTKLYSVLKARLTEKWKKLTGSFDTDEQLEPVIAPVIPAITAADETIIPATQLMPKQPEPEVALVPGSASEIDD
ncbi:unnamed protein product [Sphagnum balticum]